MAHFGRAYPMRSAVIIKTVPLTLFARIRAFFRAFFIG